jgi:lipopolysaccharide transport system permease protein
LHLGSIVNPEAELATSASEPERQRRVTIRHPGGRDGLVASLTNLIEHRELLWALTRHRLRVRYRQSVLGVTWAVLQPVTLMLIFTLAFGRIAQLPSEGIPYPLFVFTGLLTWSFVATGLSTTTNSVVAHAQLITKVYFPREILPLSYLAAALFDWAIGATVLAAMLAFYGHPITGAALAALPLLFLLTSLVAAAGFLLAALQVRFRDIGIAIPLVTYLWLFCTPVGYSLTSVPDSYRWWFLLNPMTGIVESFRAILLRGSPPDPRILFVPVLVTTVLLPLAYAVFKRTEATMADVV